MIKISTKTFYPHIISETSCSSCRDWNDKSNLKKKDGYAQCGSGSKTIAGKTGTHKNPSALSLTNFKVNIPEGSMITNIKVEYAHQKVAYKGGVPNIPAPTIALVNVSGKSTTGATPTTTMSEKSVSFSFKPATSKITSSSFGVKINYPSNANSNPGYLRLKYVRVIVTYTEPRYSVSISKADSSTKTVGDTINLNVGINNLNKVDYNPSVTISLPSGVTYNSKVSGTGSFTKSGNNIIWNPSLSSSKASSTAVIKVNLTSEGSKTVSIKESLKNASSNVTINVSEKIVENKQPVDETTKPAPEETPKGQDTVEAPKPVTITSKRKYPIIIEVELGQWASTSFQQFYLKSDTEGLQLLQAVYHEEYMTWTTEDGEYEENLVLTDLPANQEYVANEQGNYARDGKFYIFIGCKDILTANLTLYLPDPSGWSGDIYEGHFKINVIPQEEELSVPYMNLLKIDGEELNRLEKDINYIVQSYLKLNTSESEVHDWYKNFRIGVFNNQISSNIATEYIYDDTEVDEEGNPIIIEEITHDSTDYDNLTIQEIFENVGYWSEVLSKVNEFESKTVEFPYDNEYPLYILIVGDYIEGNPSENILQFTIPTLAESDTHQEGNNQCIFPVPIKGIIIDEENAAELFLSSYQTSNSVLLHDLDVGDIETTEDMAVMGVQVNLNVDLSDDMIIFVTLIDPNGVPGSRSVLITKDRILDNQITLGGPYDLWGFDIEDLTNLDDWKIEIKFANPFNSSDDSQIIFENVEIVLFVRHIEEQLVTLSLNGKDTRQYGMFIESIDIPSGLKTDVKYLKIDGTDQNAAYRQNIRKKEIEIKFRIDGCTIEETTEMLRMIGKLFTNKRDELNSPIPNQLEVSHYPGEYWDVILEDPIDSDVEATSYSSTLKLVVPDGTSYNTEDTVTSNVGTCNSIAKVNPIIDIIPTEVNASSFEITELISKQHLVINYSKFLKGDALELDCINRELILKRYSSEVRDVVDVDISDAVDWASDWFSLFGDYNFDTKNCMIQTITFTERG